MRIFTKGPRCSARIERDPRIAATRFQNRTAEKNMNGRWRICCHSASCSTLSLGAGPRRSARPPLARYARRSGGFGDRRSDLIEKLKTLPPQLFAPVVRGGVQTLFDPKSPGTARFLRGCQARLFIQGKLRLLGAQERTAECPQETDLKKQNLKITRHEHHNRALTR